MPAKQTVKYKTTRTTTRTRSKVKTNGGKKKGGNQKRCPGCGRYM